MAAKIGDRGRAACPLYPSGRVLIGNAPIAARAEAGPIEHGTEIVVVGGDRFSLIVRPFDPAHPLESLPRFGELVLNAKEDAALQASVNEEHRRQMRAEHHQLFWKLTCRAACGGLVAGIAMVAVDLWRTGYSPDLVWIPLLSAICWSCLVLVAFLMGSAAESVLFFLSIPAAVFALVAGMVIWGPFAALAICFAVGVTVNIVALLIEAMRHPIRE